MLGLSRGRRPWTDEERDFVRRSYRIAGAGIVAWALDRSVCSVHQQAEKLGLARRKPNLAAAVRRGDHDGTIRRMNAEGYADVRAAREIGVDRHEVSARRKALGLPSQALGPGFVRLQRERAQAQCAEAGVANLGRLRALSYRRYAAENGWPGDLRPRSVQVLNALAAGGVPMTRRQLAAAIGMPDDVCPRDLLVSNDPEGGVLPHLMARGLAIALPRAGPYGKPGRGSRRVNLYTLGPAALAILRSRLEEDDGEPIAQAR